MQKFLERMTYRVRPVLRKNERVKLTVKKVLALIKYAGRFRVKRVHGKRVMVPDHEKLLFDAVNIDTNNTCNLRCRFCFNEFEKKPVYMTEDIFRKILPVIPMTRPVGPGGTGVYLSCLYEPTLSPHFFDFLKMLPEEGREKVFFTSNFCRPWTDEQLNLVAGGGQSAPYKHFHRDPAGGSV